MNIEISMVNVEMIMANAEMSMVNLLGEFSVLYIYPEQELSQTLLFLSAGLTRSRKGVCRNFLF